MAITVLTLFHLKHGITAADTNLRAKLLEAEELLSCALGRKRCAYWYQQTEDPSYLYSICEWASIAEHREQFIPSESSLKISGLLQDHIDISEAQMFYIDVSPQDIPFDAPLISIGFHNVPERNRTAFEKRFRDTRYIMDEYVTREKKGAGGWRVREDNGDRLEWVLFVGWESWEQHFNFIKIDAFTEYRKILALLDGYESKHARRMDL